MGNVDSLTYAERLQTFETYWDEDKATARQLAAIGHVSDRPPLEAAEEGSRCISCSAFVKKDLSIQALDSSKPYEDGFNNFSFHHPGCIRIQVRIPLDPQAVFGLHGGRVEDLRRRFERKAANRPSPRAAAELSQTSSLFSMPTEIRLRIYEMLLPALDAETEIMSLNSDSSRVIAATGYRKTGPRDTTKANILRTCRAVREEASDLLYSNTTFFFATTKVMYLFLRSIGTTNRRHIHAVRVHCGSRDDAIAFALLASCDQLRSICISLSRPTLLLPRAPLWILDGVSCLLALRGLEQVTFRSQCGPIDLPTWGDEKPDAVFVRSELTRAKGSIANLDYIRKRSVA